MVHPFGGARPLPDLDLHGATKEIYDITYFAVSQHPQPCASSVFCYTVSIIVIVLQEHRKSFGVVHIPVSKLTTLNLHQFENFRYLPYYGSNGIPPDVQR